MAGDPAAAPRACHLPGMPGHGWQHRQHCTRTAPVIGQSQHQHEDEGASDVAAEQPPKSVCSVPKDAFAVGDARSAQHCRTCRSAAIRGG